MPTVPTRAAFYFVACVAFFLPTGVAFVGRYVDKSSFRNDTTYKALIPVVVCGALVLAVVTPAVVAMSARIPWIYRLGITLGIWFLLAIELYWLFFVVVIAR